MPNNCFFSMNVKGKTEDIKGFMKYFIFQEDEGKKTGQYLARTFLDNWKSYDDFLEEHKEYIEDGEINFTGWCAWSCWSCWFEGYPDEKTGCIKIQDLVKKYNGKIEVESEEGGMGFEEFIETDDNGEVLYSSKDMPTYKCKCGYEEGVASHQNIKDYECCECGKIGQWSKSK